MTALASPPRHRSIKSNVIRIVSRPRPSAARVRLACALAAYRRAMRAWHRAGYPESRTPGDHEDRVCEASARLSEALDRVLLADLH